MRSQQGAQAGLKPGSGDQSLITPLILALASQLSSAADKAEVTDGARLLLDQALILDGEQPANPAEFAARLSKVMMAAMG